MACEVCEHCQSPVSGEEITVREGFSYHKRCHKCYVCSETNLLNAEVFKGVIFCSSCAQRIFQGCSTARRAKTTHGGRQRRTRSRSHRRDREKVRTQDRISDRSRDGVIELAGLAGSTSDSEDHRDQRPRKHSDLEISPSAIPVEKYGREENCLYVQQLKKDSTEMGTITEVTQELIRQINNCTMVEACREKSYALETPSPPRKQHKKKETVEPIKSKPICSDLRMAELGLSTEIANMALRKKSELPVIIKFNSRLKGRKSYSLAILHQESDMSVDETDWIDSAYSSVDESENTRMMDKRLGSILKLPLKFFKKNILNRSSLISILMSSDDGQDNNLFRRLKHILREEITEHQIRGLKKLYSTINRRKIPYKLGWVDLVANVSKVTSKQSRSIGTCDEPTREQTTSVCTCDQQKREQTTSVCTCDQQKREPTNSTCACDQQTREENKTIYSYHRMKRCKHFRASHSYRCMRAQVMKLAGPTTSQLACYRHRIKKFIVPQFLRNVITSDKNYPAIKLSQPCGISFIEKP